MRNTIRTLLVVALFIPLFGVYAQQDAPDMDPLTERLYRLGFGVPPEPIEAPDFSVPDLDGREKSLASYEGKVVLLNFWATWCPPCREEMPAMEDLYNELKDSDFTILAISSRDQRGESKQKVADFIDEYGYTFPVLFDETSSAVPPFYRTGSIPTSYVINKEGYVIARLVGAHNWYSEDIVAVLKELSAD